MTLSCLGLANCSGRIDVLVHGHGDAQARGIVRRRLTHGVQQVARAVGVRIRSAALRPHHDNWLIRIQSQVKKVCGLLHGVRSVGDDHAVNILTLHLFPHRAGEIQPDFGGDLAAVDARELFDPPPSLSCRFREWPSTGRRRKPREPHRLWLGPSCWRWCRPLSR